MASLRRVFFPLKSNIAWFRGDELRKEINNRIKQAVLLYDQLLIEDGTFEANVLKVGSSSFYLPPGCVPPDRRLIEFERDLAPTTITLSIQPHGKSQKTPLLHGETTQRFKVDYFTIFKNLDLSSCDFIKLIVVPRNEFPQEAKSIIAQSTSRDKARFTSFHKSQFLNDLIIKNLNNDLVTSIWLRSAVVLDSMHHDLLKKKCLLPQEAFKFFPIKEEAVLRELFSVTVPDFDQLSLQEVIALRQDKLWVDFREFVGRISDSVSQNPNMLIDYRDLQHEVTTAINRELFDELKNRHPTGIDLTVQLGLGLTSLIPGFGLISTGISAANSVESYLQGKSGWFSFLLKLTKRPAT